MGYGKLVLSEMFLSPVFGNYYIKSNNERYLQVVVNEEKFDLFKESKTKNGTYEFV